MSVRNVRLKTLSKLTHSKPQNDNLNIFDIFYTNYFGKCLVDHWLIVSNEAGTETSMTMMMVMVMVVVMATATMIAYWNENISFSVVSQINYCHHRWPGAGAGAYKFSLFIDQI